MVKISPSLLAANFAFLENEIKALEAAGADYIHLDIMDGHFVPNISFGAEIIKTVRSLTKLPLDVHLMINPIMPHLRSFIEAGADIMTVHLEASDNILDVLGYIRAKNIKCGITLKPDTPIENLNPYLSLVDWVLIMSVNPGFSGQKFMPRALERIRYIKEKITSLPKYPLICVDGGVTIENAPEIIQAGANVLVAGQTIFSNPSSKYATIISQLRAGHSA